LYHFVTRALSAECHLGDGHDIRVEDFRGLGHRLRLRVRRGWYLPQILSLSILGRACGEAIWYVLLRYLHRLESWVSSEGWTETPLSTNCPTISWGLGGGFERCPRASAKFARDFDFLGTDQQE